MSEEKQTTKALVRQTEGGTFETEQSFVLAQRAAKALCSSSLVPESYRGERNIGNCMIALEMAHRMRANSLSVMQNLHIISGKPAWSSTFIIAAINASGKFSPLRFTVSGAGDERTCVAWAYDKSTGEKLEGPPVSIGMAKAEGWYQRKGSKWPNMPDLMLRYRAAAFFGRLYAPGLTMGMQTTEEVIDAGLSSTPAAPAEPEFHKIKPADAEVVEPEPEPEKKPARTRRSAIVKAVEDAGLTEEDVLSRAVEMGWASGTPERLDELSKDEKQFIMENLEAING